MTSAARNVRARARRARSDGGGAPLRGRRRARQPRLVAAGLRRGAAAAATRLQFPGFRNRLSGSAGLTRACVMVDSITGLPSISTLFVYGYWIAPTGRQSP